MPERIQLRRTAGWRKPEGALVVSRPSDWSNPFAIGTNTALARVPALDGSPWEYESRISAAGMSHDYQHADGHWTRHTVRYMTRQECVGLFERALVHPTQELHLSRNIYERQKRGPRKYVRTERLTVELARAELAGRDLACWCSIWDACHADVLLRIANETA
jgi:hypothetical protein